MYHQLRKSNQDFKQFCGNVKSMAESRGLDLLAFLSKVSKQPREQRDLLKKCISKCNVFNIPYFCITYYI